MQVDCQSCKQGFDVPLKTAGKIEYSRCENVFRVAYRFKTACPHCKSILQLSPNGSSNKVVGIAQNFEKDEKTEALILVNETDETLPRTGTDLGVDFKPSPTAQTKKVESVKSKPQFILTHSEEVLVRKPIHVSLRPEKTYSFPIRKILFVGVIAVSTAITVLMTAMAIQNSKRSPLKPSTPPKPKSVTISQVASVPFESHIEELPEEKEEKNAFYVQHLDKITSKYGKRIDPIDFEPRFHHGLDIAAKNRAEILAALEGVVEFAGTNGGYGNMVIIRHEGGYETRYAHLAKTLAKEGKHVKQGDLIGLAGSTGRSTGTHLHFELRKDGKPVDPYRVELMSKATKTS